MQCGMRRKARLQASPRPRATDKVGVIWHTQGSGKSLLMAFYAGQLVRAPRTGEPDDRCHHRSQRSGRSAFRYVFDVPRSDPANADPGRQPRRSASGAEPRLGRRHLHDHPEVLAGVRRSDLSDAVRSAEHRRDRRRSPPQPVWLSRAIEQKTGEIAYGFAKYLRDALPNASFIGFTGTPIEKDDVNTPAVFGEYIDVYDISRAVEDGATVRSTTKAASRASSFPKRRSPRSMPRSRS